MLLCAWFDVANGTGQGDIHGQPTFNVCLNWAAEIVEMHKAISRGLVLQEGTAELEERHLLTQIMRIWRFSIGLKMVYRKQQIFYPIMPYTQAQD